MYFKDVADDKWYSEAVEVVSDLGLMVGDMDEFRPNEYLTRAEAASLVARLVRYINHEPVL